MIYTSYYANLGKLPSHIVPISIAGKAPEWYKGIQFKKLAPKFNIFSEYKLTGNIEVYTQRYTSLILEQLDAELISKELLIIASSADVALICYEAPNKFCHRKIVANWFNKFNVPCTEYTNEVS